jgi:transposase InsO family protein
MDERKSIVEELHKPVRRNFPRRSTVVKGIHDLYQADLVEMKPYSRINKGFKYILTVIDCFTKVASAIPLKNKSGPSITEAMKRVLQAIGKRIKNLQTDDGKEFFNKDFSDLMKKNKINHYSSYSEKKAAIVERFNRTLKTSMYKKFSERGTYVWYDILPTLIKDYNDKKHRTIGMKPNQVNKTNENTVLKRIKKSTKLLLDKKPPKTFSIGDNVRISKYKQIFTKGYLPNWTNEVFTVHRVQPTIPETYILKDSKGEILHGGFYGHELLKSKTGNVYLVEKILRKRGNQLLVRWLGFDKSEDTWIDKKDLL